MSESFFFFNLDGTITSNDLMPEIAREAGLEEEMVILDQLTRSGGVEFESSLRLRFALLRCLPLERIQALMDQINLEPRIVEFIHERPAQCAVLSCGPAIWFEKLSNKLGCRLMASEVSQHDTLFKMSAVLNKGQAVRSLAQKGRRLIAIGAGPSDVPMFEEADIGVAYGRRHAPVPDLVQISDYVVYTGEALCRLLRTL